MRELLSEQVALGSQRSALCLGPSATSRTSKKSTICTGQATCEYGGPLRLPDAVQTQPPPLVEPLQRLHHVRMVSQRSDRSLAIGQPFAPARASPPWDGAETPTPSAGVAISVSTCAAALNPVLLAGSARSAKPLLLALGAPEHLKIQPVRPGRKPQLEAAPPPGSQTAPSSWCPKGVMPYPPKPPHRLLEPLWPLIADVVVGHR